jgi:F-type H+-transporting ATPase subunit delta
LSALSQRYAAALADVALAHNAAAGIRGELADVAGTYQESSDLRNLLSNPAVSGEVKKSLLGKLAERMQLSQGMRNFLFVLVDHHRVELLPHLLSAYDTEVHARMGIAEAQVTSAHELSVQEKQELTAALERLTQKKVEAQFSVADSLLGGAVVQIGSTIYDGSVRQQLESLRTTLESE